MAGSTPLTVWVLTAVGFAVIVVLDLVVIARRRAPVSLRQATLWVTLYVALAALFAAGLFLFRGEARGSEFVAGYITEYSLSVDNLFVFVIIMARFRVPPLAVDKVLYIGIAVSMLLRGGVIAAGAAAIAAASWVFYLFGAFLLYTAIRLALERSDEGEPEFQENALVRGLRRVLPLSPDYRGAALTVGTGRGRTMTPLVIVIAAIGIANVVFALDSLPAIFGLTQDPYVIVTANAFALMGLRQLYFLVGGLLDRIVFLNVGLSVILAFIGVKLLVEALHGSHVDDIGAVPLPHIGTLFSLAFILGVLTATVSASLAKQRWGLQRTC
jgi:TerC family integral membrane protein